MAVGADAAAGAVAQVFGAIHRAGHAGAVQNTLAAHLAVEDPAFEDLLAPDEQAFGQPGVEALHEGVGPGDEGLGLVVKRL